MGDKYILEKLTGFDKEALPGIGIFLNGAQEHGFIVIGAMNPETCLALPAFSIFHRLLASSSGI